MYLLNRMTMLQIDRITPDEAVELMTIAREAEKTYRSYEMSPPGWLTEGMATLDGEIKRKRRDMLMARQQELRAQLATLKTREEKRTELEAEQAKIDAALKS